MSDLYATAQRFAALDASLVGRDPTDAEATEWLTLSSLIAHGSDGSQWLHGPGWTWVMSLRHAVAAILDEGSA